MRINLAIALAWATTARAAFYVDRFAAAVNPSPIDGKWASFCQFHVKSDTTINATACSHWTSSPDLTIQDLDNVACESDPNLTWSLTRPDSTGYNFDIHWVQDEAASFGTYWIPKSLIAWAWADGERVQVYAGPRSFVVPSE